MCAMLYYYKPFLARFCALQCYSTVLCYIFVLWQLRLLQFQIFWEARRLKTIVYKATSLKVVLRLQIKTLPGNSSRMESMTTQDVSKRENMRQKTTCLKFKRVSFCMSV